KSLETCERRISSSRSERAALSGQLQCWPKSQACRQHEQHIRAEIPPSAFHERRDPRLSDPQLFSRLALSPAPLLDVLAQGRHQTGPHREHTGLGFIEAEIIKHAASRRSDMTRPVLIVSALFHR